MFQLHPASPLLHCSASLLLASSSSFHFHCSSASLFLALLLAAFQSHTNSILHFLSLASSLAIQASSVVIWSSSVDMVDGERKENTHGTNEHDLNTWPLHIRGLMGLGLKGEVMLLPRPRPTPRSISTPRSQPKPNYPLYSTLVFHHNQAPISITSQVPIPSHDPLRSSVLG